MRVTVIDCSVSGHREVYYKQFARTWAEMGHEISLIAPDGKGIDRRISFRNIPLYALHALPTGKPLKKKMTVLLNAWLRLLNLYRIRKSLQHSGTDLVFFACLDDMLPLLSPLWLFNYLFPYKWSGLFVQSELPPYKFGMPDIRPFLRSKNCIGIGVLNEFSACNLQQFNKNILIFPDFTDTSAPDTSYTLLQEVKSRAGKRKIVSLLGSVNLRKGVKLLQQSILLLPEEDYFFLIAGKSSLSVEEEAELRTLEESRSNCLFSFDKIPDERCFNALVAASDVIFAAYRHFTGSSNLLTKAAVFHKPVVVSESYCMGKRVEHYGTGKAIPENDAKECSDAIRSLCAGTGIDVQAFSGYEESHRVNKLTTCFNQINQRL